VLIGNVVCTVYALICAVMLNLSGGKAAAKTSQRTSLQTKTAIDVTSSTGEKQTASVTADRYCIPVTLRREFRAMHLGAHYAKVVQQDTYQVRGLDEKAAFGRVGEDWQHGTKGLL
jgi:hypothetical protein